jgi:hypothetical protein
VLSSPPLPQTTRVQIAPLADNKAKEADSDNSDNIDLSAVPFPESRLVPRPLPCRIPGFPALVDPTILAGQDGHFPFYFPLNQPTNYVDTSNGMEVPERVGLDWRVGGEVNLHPLVGSFPKQLAYHQPIQMGDRNVPLGTWIGLNEPGPWIGVPPVNFPIPDFSPPGQQATLSLGDSSPTSLASSRDLDPPSDPSVARQPSSSWSPPDNAAADLWDPETFHDGGAFASDEDSLIEEFFNLDDLSMPQSDDLCGGYDGGTQILEKDVAGYDTPGKEPDIVGLGTSLVTLSTAGEGDVDSSNAAKIGASAGPTLFQHNRLGYRSESESSSSKHTTN